MIERPVETPGEDWEVSGRKQDTSCTVKDGVRPLLPALDINWCELSEEGAMGCDDHHIAEKPGLSGLGRILSERFAVVIFEFIVLTSYCLES